MKLLLSRTKMFDVARRFADQYPTDKYPADSKFGKTRARLEDLDPSLASPAEAAEIIGNKSWTHFCCSECGQEVEQAVAITEDYSDHVTILCPSCARAVAALASVVVQQ